MRNNIALLLHRQHAKIHGMSPEMIDTAENQYKFLPTPSAVSDRSPPPKVSGDFNPIHTNPYFTAYASLPGTTTHGMFSSVATGRCTWRPS
jgi:fatty acid synthase subunit beta